MTDTDIEYGDRIGSGLKDASASFSPPGGMFPRVAERDRQHDRRRASVRVGALGIAAVVTLGGIAWVRLVRTDESTAANQPVQVPPTLTGSANADRIDAYPIINWRGDPLPNVRAGYGTHDDDQGWEGTIGVLHPDRAPTSVVAVHVFPAGWDTSFPDSRPGRVAGVEETAVTNGNTTLTWKVGDIPVAATGNDVDLMYQLVDLVEPVAATVQRGGYQFNGPLPNGSSELEAPYHRIAMRSPLVANDDGTFSVAVEQGPVLNVLAGGGSTTLDRVTINGLNGYKSTTGDPTIALAITSDETLYLSARTLTMEQLTAIAQGVTITDGASWRAHYELAD